MSELKHAKCVFQDVVIFVGVSHLSMTKTVCSSMSCRPKVDLRLIVIAVLGRKSRLLSPITVNALTVSIANV